jgi:uncharacterized protein (DUF1697 family)
MSHYLALLRGINVGGKNLIKMSELKACLEKLGLEDVATYIQSGNVIFTAPESGRAKLVSRIEGVLAKTFGYEASVVLRTQKQLEDVVAHAPEGFGTEPAKYRYDVLFLKEPLTAAVALKSVPTRAGVDAAHAGKGVLYFSRLIRKATQSQLNRLAALPVYQNMTIRNWNTTTALVRLMREAAGG